MFISDIKDYNDLFQDGYLKIRNHGIISNNRTAILVGMEGTIDWACIPDFDSKPVFDSILDKDKGGMFSIFPESPERLSVRQYYKEYTNILVTEFLKDNSKILRITDFIPVSDYNTITFAEIYRLVESFSEQLNLHIIFKPHFLDSESTMVEKRKEGFIFRSRDQSIGIVSGFKLSKKNNIIDSVVEMGRNSAKWVIAPYGVRYLNPMGDYRPYQNMEMTTDYWRKWVHESNYRGIFNSEVIRSSLTLKSLFYEPTGLMVAAPTASLPEKIGGQRNWDYRFTWVRDTAYVIEALSSLGYKKEATKFLYDLMDRIRKEGTLRTIYPISEHSNDLQEREMYYSGYLGSKPVRFGNLASEQLQMDQYGSIIEAIYHLDKAGGLISPSLWEFVGETLDIIGENWSKPDSSIWEVRTEQKHYVYSKVMAWNAFDKAIIIGKKHEFSGKYKKWRSIANAIRTDVLERGFNHTTGSFTQFYGSDRADASLLRIPLTGFMSEKNKMFIGTLKHIVSELMTDDYAFFRYRSDDGLSGDDNTFFLLSFWYAQVLILLKKYSEAKSVIDSLLEKGNHLGLFSEEYDVLTRELMGNFPQAITHLGIITSCVSLNNALNKEKMNEIMAV